MFGESSLFLTIMECLNLIVCIVLLETPAICFNNIIIFIVAALSLYLYIITINDFRY